MKVNFLDVLQGSPFPSACPPLGVFVPSKPAVGPGSCSDATPLSSPVILELPAHMLLSSSAAAGQPWKRISRSLVLLVPGAVMLRSLTNLLQVFYNLCPSPQELGTTSLEILSLGFPPSAGNTVVATVHNSLNNSFNPFLSFSY